MRFVMFERPDGGLVWINPAAVSMVSLDAEREGMSRISLAGAHQTVRGVPTGVIEALEKDGRKAES